MFTEFGPDQLRFAGLIPERLIFAPKSQYNIGFQPTKKLLFYNNVNTSFTRQLVETTVSSKKQQIN